MTGSIEVNLPLKKGKKFYVSNKDFDSRLGGDFYMFLEPLEGTDGSRFFYVKPLNGGKVEISGEGYIVNPGALAPRKKEAAESYEADNIRYFIIGSDGSVIKELSEVVKSDL